MSPLGNFVRAAIIAYPMAGLIVGSIYTPKDSVKFLIIILIVSAIHLKALIATREKRPTKPYILIVMTVFWVMFALGWMIGLLAIRFGGSTLVLTLLGLLILLFLAVEVGISRIQNEPGSNELERSPQSASGYASHENAVAMYMRLRDQAGANDHLTESGKTLFIFSLTQVPTNTILSWCKKINAAMDKGMQRDQLLELIVSLQDIKS